MMNKRYFLGGWIVVGFLLSSSLLCHLAAEVVYQGVVEGLEVESEISLENSMLSIPRSDVTGKDQIKNVVEEAKDTTKHKVRYRNPR